MSSDSRRRLQILIAFAVVYLVWGSTYLGIRIGVRDIPPAMLAGVRNLVAGLVIWAEVELPSNQAALIASTSALWVAWFGTLGPRRHALGLRVKIGLIVGFAGTALMLMPGAHFTLGHFGAQLLILVSSLCWGIGVIYGRSFSLNMCSSD